MSTNEVRNIIFQKTGTYIETANGPIHIGSPDEFSSVIEELNSIFCDLDSRYSIEDKQRNDRILEMAIKQIQKNSSLRRRIISAVKAGGISAFEQALNHPAASFFINAIKDWKS
jgi:hypothetical protein